MNKIELIGLIREIVKDELKELLKSKEGRAIVREMIDKGVRSEVDRLLTDMENSQGEVVTERLPDTKLTKMVERGELPPKTTTKKSEPAKPLPLAKDKKLNDLLNQTLDSIRKGEAALPSTIGAEGQAQLLREQYASSDWKTMGSTFTSEQARSFSGATPPRVGEDSGKSVAAMMPDVDVNGNPLVVRNVPDHVGKALTRNYSKLMKKVEEKRG